MLFGSLDYVYAALTGVSVLVVTLLGDRLGGRVGGLLATAPITTSAAHVVIATSVPAALASARVLQGISALLAATFAIIAFFYAVKFTRGRSSAARLAIGLGAYVVVFFPLTLALASAGITPAAGFLLLFAIHAALAFSFMREPVPVLAAAPNARRTFPELFARFAAGALVILAIRALVSIEPALAGALAVVPGVFVGSLTVMGMQRDAPFAARAAQAGLFGTTAVALFVLVIAGGLKLGVWGGVWTMLPFGWAAYAAVLTFLGKLHRRIQTEPLEST